MLRTLGISPPKVTFIGETKKNSSFKMRSITALFFLFCFLAPSALAQLRFGFYGRSCPRAESIVANVVANRFRRDRSITAALLRMQFHDCFVRVSKLLLIMLCAHTYIYMSSLSIVSRRFSHN